MARLHGPLIVPDAKILRCLLDPLHPIGGVKAQAFAMFGFTRANADALVAAIIEHAEANAVHCERWHSRGTNRVIRGPLIDPAGRRPSFDIVWFRATGDSGHRLVIAYPS